MRRTVVLAATILAATCGSAWAQSRQAPARRVSPPPVAGSDRFSILVDGGAQLAVGSFGQSFTLTKNVESAPVTTDLKVGTSGFFDAGVRMRFARRLSVGVVGFASSGTAAGTVDAKVPHPFYFNQSRDVSGSLSGLSRKEAGVHVELAYRATVARRGEVTLFGGPSYISAEQDLVADVTYSDTYPYDTATFTAAPTTTARGSAAGVNLGGEAMWLLNRRVGISGLVRYTRATIELSAGSGNTVSATAGGIQAGAGLRLFFGRSVTSTKRPVPPKAPKKK